MGVGLQAKKKCNMINYMFVWVFCRSQLNHLLSTVTLTSQNTSLLDATLSRDVRYHEAARVFTCLFVGGGSLMTSSSWSQRSSDRKREWPALLIWRGLPLWKRGSCCPGNSGNLTKKKKDQESNINPLLLHGSQTRTTCTVKDPRMWHRSINYNNCLHTTNWYLCLLSLGPLFEFCNHRHVPAEQRLTCDFWQTFGQKCFFHLYSVSQQVDVESPLTAEPLIVLLKQVKKHISPNNMYFFKLALCGQYFASLQSYQ